MSREPEQDAIVVGAGHNGLVAAAYLARAGSRVAVVEARPVVGGAAVTEELAPGFRVSTASYSLGLLRPDIHRELDLARHGLTLIPKEPQLFAPETGGRGFFVWRDASRTCDELARIHPPDADGYRRWCAFWEEAVPLLRELVDDPEPPPLADVEGWLGRRGRTDIWRLAIASSAAECVEAFFEAPEIQGVFASQGIIGTWASVRDPGTAWVLAYHALGGELAGAQGTWAYVRGGMGALTQALASAASEAGAEVHTGTPVDEVLVDDGRATGVRLTDGRVLRSRVVVSGADPRATFLGLVPDGALDASFLEHVRAWPTPGCVLKVNLALDGLPDLAATPRPSPGPQHAGTIEIAPSIDYLADAFEEARAGAPSSRPFMEVFIQSVVDDTLALPGQHVLSAFTQYVPPVSDDWDAVRAKAYLNVLETLSLYMPDLPQRIVGRDCLGPPELEARFGLTGGNIFHGEILPEHCFGNRFSYRTPLPGLYLCGSGAPPGGGVMGAAGRNAAKTILADLGHG